MEFTAVIPYRNGHETLPALLDDLAAAGVPVVVVDDQSATPAPADALMRHPNARLLELNRRRYFAGAVNTAIAQTRGDLLILNQDMRLHGQAWLDWLAENASAHAISGTGQMKHPAWPRGYVQGQFMYLRRDALDAVGLFNERDYPLWGGTAEYQLRACRKGYTALPVESIPGVEHLRAGGFGATITAALADEPGQRDWLVRTPPLVSVIITSRNYGRYLRDAVNSLVGGPTSLGLHPGQTLQSFEAIIVDDASEDETAAVGQDLADPWKAIRYIRRNVRGGTPAANNTGIRASFGHYITILCADDMRTPESLEALYRVCEKMPTAVAYDDIEEFAHGARTQKRQLGQYSFDSLVKKNMMHAGIMVHRLGLDKAGGYDERFVDGREDWQINIGLGLQGYCGQRVPQFGYLYRREGQNRSLGNAGPEWFAFFQSQLRETYPLLYQGVKPMSCCGGSARDSGSSDLGNLAASNNASGGGAEEMSVGQEGMVLLEYLGGNAGEESWYGPVTSLRYLFSTGKRTAYVDQRDAAAMIAIRENRRPVFELAAAPEAAPVVHVARPQPSAETVSLQTVSTPTDTSAPAEAQAELPLGDDPNAAPGDMAFPYRTADGWADLDPRVLSVSAFKAALAEAKPDAGQLAALLAAEKDNGAPRKGIVDLIEKALADSESADA